MDKMNWLLIFGTGLVPLITGMIWYNRMVMGNAWMAASGMTEEKAKGMNMPLTFGLVVLFGMMLSMVMLNTVVHQMSVYSIFAGPEDAERLKDPTSALSLYLKNFFDLYGHNFRSFKHGVLHGVIAALFFTLPVTGMSALFERRGFKYIAIHTGYWILTLALMGGIICQWA